MPRLSQMLQVLPSDKHSLLWLASWHSALWLAEHHKSEMDASTLLLLLKPRLTQIFPHRGLDMWGPVWMNRFRRAWQSLNFDKEYLFGFETLVFATSGIVSIHKQLVTLQREYEN